MMAPRTNQILAQWVLGLIIAILIATAGIAQAQSSSAIRTINFSGYEWIVKYSNTVTGPGNNHFSSSSESVWVDKLGQLHLKMIKRNGTWYSAEVNTTRSLGYGKYYFFVASRIDKLDKNVVTGLVTWDDSPQYNHREIDLEFSRWGNKNNSNSQYVIQPYNYPGNMKRFNMQLGGNYTTHSFVWKNKSLSFQSLHGHYYSPPNPSYIIQSWNYTGKYNPLHGNETVHINLWLYDGNWDGIGDSPSDGNETELIIKRFEYIPVAAKTR